MDRNKRKQEQLVEIEPDKVSLKFDPLITAYRIIKFDNSPFFENIGKDRINFIIRRINRGIETLICKIRMQYGRTHFGWVVALTQILILLLFGFFLFVFVFYESKYYTLQDLLIRYHWILVVIFGVIAGLLLILCIVIINKKSHFNSLPDAIKALVIDEIKDHEDEFLKKGYVWEYHENKTIEIRKSLIGSD